MHAKYGGLYIWNLEEMTKVFNNGQTATDRQYCKPFLIRERFIFTTVARIIHSRI